MNTAELMIKKKELEERLEKIKKDLSTMLDANLEDQAIQLENRDVLLEIARVSEEELQRINIELGN
jgi:RNA polymerase-binding transcription factor DksA